MNDPAVEVVPVETPGYKDRSVGLIIFGILTILAGCLVGLLLPLMIFGQTMAARRGQPAMNHSSMLFAVMFYGGLAGAMVWLGIGSIMARRWARALLLIFSWAWLVFGVLVFGFLLFLFSWITHEAGRNGQQRAGEMVAVMVVTSLVAGVIFIVVPAVWVFFYRSRHVKETCEARSPWSSWTDAIPLPVLGLFLWMVASALMLLFMPFVGHGVMPFFGMFLAGWPGSLVYLLVAAISAYAAWLIYELDVRGWWVILVTVVFLVVSAVETYSVHGVLEMYQLMGYPPAQIDQMQRMGWLTGNRMSWFTGLSTLPILGYLLFVKKYFKRPA